MRLTLFCLALVAATAGAQDRPRFTFRRDTALLDEKLHIVLHGAPPSRIVSIRLATQLSAAEATFFADTNGVVDLSRDIPFTGDYGTADAMGLFWSARPDMSRPRPSLAANRRVGAAPQVGSWVITATVDSTVIATDTIWRRAVAANVRLTTVRENGIVGVLYEPEGTTRRPAVIVLAGSLGGTTPANNWPGGLASRGYVVLSLPFFNDEGLPPTLVDIPLEYFERAIQFLRARPSVNPDRIGLLGGSRGGELSLLLGATYPTLIRAIVAFSPSSVVWPGCCDPASVIRDSWTLGGKPVPHMPIMANLDSIVDAVAAGKPVRLAAGFQRRLDDTAAARRAAIKVEKIGGPVLLISGKDDGLWPSERMGNEVIARLKAHDFPHPYRHLSYEGLGHTISRPYTTTTAPLPATSSGRLTDAGGSPAGIARGREQLWGEILSFFDRYLKR